LSNYNIFKVRRPSGVAFWALAFWALIYSSESISVCQPFSKSFLGIFLRLPKTGYSARFKQK
ncbi:MAG: hypothetical protein DSM106950_40520, partial [Stigonema ocellatum SAG 48.90 = DSM 106950]|nr:hypothetical protein [Stigonema ocellatum SAG 48.90 = DSM 106950]